MADQPSFSRCPYCQRKLDKRPQRKSKCPHCGEVIYVRAGDLLREDELEADAKPKPTPANRKPARQTDKKTAKKTDKKTDKKTSNASSKKPKSTGATDTGKKSTAKSKPKNKLEADLKRKKKKGAFTQNDLQAGLMLVIKLLGKFLKPEQIAQIFGGLLGGGGPATRSAFVDVDTDSLLAEAAQVYDDLNEEDQRHLLAVFTWVQNGFSLDENTQEAVEADEAEAVG